MDHKHRQPASAGVALVRRHDPEMLDRISTAETWLRRCNEQPPEGKPISRQGLRVVLATSSAVATRADGVITWRLDGRTFTAEPVRDDAGDKRFPLMVTPDIPPAGPTTDARTVQSGRRCVRDLASPIQDGMIIFFRVQPAAVQSSRTLYSA